MCARVHVCVSAMQALRLQRTARTSNVETSLRDVITARFLRAGDDMRRTLIRACTRALAMTRGEADADRPPALTPGTPSARQATAGQSAVACLLADSPLAQPPPLVVTRIQQGLIQQILTVRG